MEGDRGTDVRDRIVYCWPTVLRQKKKEREQDWALQQHHD